MRWLLASVFVSLAVVSNWLASRFTITVPFTSLVAPAGVLTIGACFVLRDWLAQVAGFRFGLAVIPVAGAASYLIGFTAGWSSLQKIAVASVIAFVVSETVEAAVFAPIRKRSLAAGVLASGIVGNALDSWLFLMLAFGSLSFFWGNFVGKLEMILLGAALTAARRVWVPVRS